MSEVVKFPINTPVEVTLQDEAGKRVEGRYGDQVMYSLLDNRVMYVPPYVEQRLQALAVWVDEPLVLCKQQVKEGTRNKTQWSVKRAPQQPYAPANENAFADAAAPQTTPGLLPEKEMATRNGDAQPGAQQALTLMPDEGRRNGGNGREVVLNGVVKQKEQPSGNSPAPMAQESASTNTHHQRQDSAGCVEIVLAATRPVELSAKDRMYLPAMSMEVALARRSAIVEFTRRIMVKDLDFSEIPGTSKPTLLKPGAEKLCNFFGLEPEFTPIVEDIDWMGAQHGGEVFC